MIVRYLSGVPLPHSAIKLLNVRSQYFHSLAAVGELGFRFSRLGFRRFMVSDDNYNVEYIVVRWVGWRERESTLFT